MFFLLNNKQHSILCSKFDNNKMKSVTFRNDLHVKILIYFFRLPWKNVLPGGSIKTQVGDGNQPHLFALYILYTHPPILSLNPILGSTFSSDLEHSKSKKVPHSGPTMGDLRVTFHATTGQKH